MGDDVGATLAALPWQTTAALLAVALLVVTHYGLSSYALRAAGGGGFSVREGTLAQLAAAAANRVTAAGIGGAGVNVRYLTRRGLRPEQALAAVGAVGLLGGLADLLVLGGTLAATGTAALRPLAVQAQHVGRVTGAVPAPVTAAVAVLVLAGAGWVVLRRRGRQRDTPRPGLAAGLRDGWRHLRTLLNAPRRVLSMMGASAGTTLAMALAFAATTTALVGGHAPAPATLVVGYLVAGVAGAAVPLPGGVGSTEALLVAVLAAAGTPLGTAVRTVLVFRVLTFWAPAAVGVLAARTLRRRGAI